MAHLALEKILKAYVVRATSEVPPRIHNLDKLAEIAGLELSREQRELLREFEAYQIEGRYPDQNQVEIGSQIAERDFERAKGMLEWLKEKF